MYFNVNADSVVTYTNKLEKLGKTYFPKVVLGTLNDAAFDVKTNSMPSSARSEFEHRQPNFFKANSKYFPAQGMNIKTMQSDVGFYDNNLKNKSTNYAVKDLEQQEEGGTINKKTFIPMKNARVGGRGNVRANARLSNIKNLVKTADKEGIPKAIAKAGKGGFILTNKAVFRVLAKGKIEPVYSFKSKRSVKVSRTNFMREASQVTANKMDDFFIKRAKVQFKKAGFIK